jgi:hypothetical protein
MPELRVSEKERSFCMHSNFRVVSLNGLIMAEHAMLQKKDEAKLLALRVYHLMES